MVLRAPLTVLPTKYHNHIPEFRAAYLLIFGCILGLLLLIILKLGQPTTPRSFSAAGGGVVSS